MSIYHATYTDLLKAFELLKQTPADYPPALLATRRESVQQQIRELDPDSVDGESRVTPEQDARNSRPEPY